MFPLTQNASPVRAGPVYCTLGYLWVLGSKEEMKFKQLPSSPGGAFVFYWAGEKKSPLKKKREKELPIKIRNLVLMHCNIVL